MDVEVVVVDFDAGVFCLFGCFLEPFDVLFDRDLALFAICEFCDGLGINLL